MKILIINPFGIGDVIFSTPLVEIIKLHYPDSVIGYICNRRAYEVIKSNPNLPKVFIYEKDDYRAYWQNSKIDCVKRIAQFLGSIKKERFEISIDLSLGYQYSMFLKLLGVRRRLGFNYRERGMFLTDKIDIDGFNDKHVIEYYIDMARLLDIDVKKYRIEPRVYVSEFEKARAEDILRINHIDDGELVIGMIPGCGASWGLDAEYRRWDKRGFAELADCLVKRYNARIMLLGDSKEVAICRDVQGLVKGNVINYCGNTTIGEFMGLLAKCRIVITNDGGPLHMAVGLGVKTVSIFGPVDETVYGPYPADGRHIVVSRKDMPCRPCYRAFKHARCEDRLCLGTIAVSDVLKASELLLKP